MVPIHSIFSHKKISFSPTTSVIEFEGSSPSSEISGIEKIDYLSEDLGKEGTTEKLWQIYKKYISDQ